MFHIIYLNYIHRQTIISVGCTLEISIVFEIIEIKACFIVNYATNVNNPVSPSETLITKIQLLSDGSLCTNIPVSQIWSNGAFQWWGFGIVHI